MGTVRKRKEIRDPLHGDIEFDVFEQDIINTPVFQRMRGIRQLGLGYLVYPGAHHTRFEHSLGVAHMATQIALVLRRNCGEEIISDNEIRFIRVLGLLHDIGHVPFGHTLEDERPIYNKAQHHDKKERLSIYFNDPQLNQALLALGKDIDRKDLPQDILRLMEHTHEGGDKASMTPREELLANIIGNTICSDLLDYLKRDPYYTGIHHTYDEKFLSTFEIRDSQIYLNLRKGNNIRHGVASEILHLLRLRYTLGERVYYHLTKSSASAMISKAVELSGLDHTILAKLRDEELLYVLENAQTEQKVFGEKIKNIKQTSDIVKKIRQRKLYLPVYSISRSEAEKEHCLDELVTNFHTSDQLEYRAKVENKIAKYVGLDPHQIIIYCPDKKMSTKAAMVKVLWPKEKHPIPLQELCQERHGIEDENIRMEIEQLKNKHESLWQLTVFVDKDCSNQQLRDVSIYCQALSEFYKIENQNEEYKTSHEEIVCDRVLCRALEECPVGDEVDVQAVGELLKSDNKGGRIELTVKDIQKRILRKQKGKKGQMEFGE